MATREINLLIKREGQLSAVQKKQLASVKKWVPTGLAVYLVLLVLILGGGIYVNAQDRQLDDQIETTSTAIESLTQNEGIYLILKQKIGSITRIINTRYNYLEVFDFFKNLELDNGKITKITLTLDGKTDLGFSVNDSEAMDRVVTGIISQAEERFTSVKLVSVRLGESSGYVMELDIQV